MRPELLDATNDWWMRHDLMAPRGGFTDPIEMQIGDHAKRKKRFATAPEAVIVIVCEPPGPSGDPICACDNRPAGAGLAMTRIGRLTGWG